jgi:hypothetical protein
MKTILYSCLFIGVSIITSCKKNDTQPAGPAFYGQWDLDDDDQNNINANNAASYLSDKKDPTWNFSSNGKYQFQYTKQPTGQMYFENGKWELNTSTEKITFQPSASAAYTCGFHKIGNGRALAGLSVKVMTIQKNVEGVLVDVDSLQTIYIEQ